MNNPLIRINTRARYCVGIDPDKNESGFALYDRKAGRFLEHKSLFFYPLQSRCFDFEKDEVEFYVEAGWENKGMNAYQSKSRPSGFDKWSRDRREGYTFQRGCDVGINFGAGWAITHILRANGYIVHHYCPNTPKWDAEMLRKITGITAPTNQDTRDAIRAAYLNR